MFFYVDKFVDSLVLLHLHYINGACCVVVPLHLYAIRALTYNNSTTAYRP